LKIRRVFFHVVALLSVTLMPVAHAQQNSAPCDPMRPPCFLVGHSECAELPAPTEGERFAGFLVLYFDFLSLIALALPRLWFVWCFRTLFPFMPERIEEIDDKKQT
jgi:hypothetical protein